MNSCTFSGKIYKLEDKGSKDKAQVMLRIGTRKPFVSDADKKANKVNIFMGMSAYGATAEFITKYFKEDDFIEINAQYEPYENKDGDEVPWFKIRDVNFPAGGSANHDKDDDDKPSRGNRRNRDNDEAEDDRSSRGSRRNRREEPEDNEDDMPPRRRRASGDRSPF